MSTLEYATPIDTRAKLDWKALLSRLGPFIGLIFVVVLFFFLAIHHSGRNTFLTNTNIQIMLLQTAVVATGALGMTIIIVSGGIDLSVGSVVALSTITLMLWLLSR